VSTSDRIIPAGHLTTRRSLNDRGQSTKWFETVSEVTPISTLIRLARSLVPAVPAKSGVYHGRPTS